MAQKILAGRCSDPTLSGDLVQVKVDQVVLSRDPLRAIAEARELGLKKTTAEVAIAYDTTCATSGDPRAPHAQLRAATAELLGHGVLLGRPGVGFPGPVHLERFASPARLCVTDDPRLASVGGIGMMPMVVPPGMLGQALAQGTIHLRPPRSVQVLLTGRTRPFVCARDIAHELVRRGLGEAVARIEAAHGAPVILEFAGPSARLLSVFERAVLAGIAPMLGAASALFTSDERTEVFLRDQRRSKAHRALVADPGAPCDEVLNVDLGAVDPLYMDETGQVRSVRDLAGKPVSQVVLGGDGGATLRDLFAAATLLKSKRVPSRVEFLIAVPSRQMLEVLSSSGALTDLIATGARLVEPDARILTGELYPPAAGGLSLRTHDPEPGPLAPRPLAVASAETLAYAVATGEVGDPRSFKRPVRVTIPRALPTDDVLITRDRKSADAASKKASTLAIPAATPWKTALSLELVEGTARLAAGAEARDSRPLAVVCRSLDEVREVATRASELSSSVRAIFATFIPSGLVGVLSGAGIAALGVDASALATLSGAKTPRSVDLPAPPAANEKESLTLSLGSHKVHARWLARGIERAWTMSGSARPSSRARG